MRSAWVGAVIATIVLPAAPARAQGMCHAVEVSLRPEKRADLRPARQQPPQIVAWVERPDGSYVATIFITQATGTYGLGNRPGRMDFNSGPDWPYGRRTSVFPVWAERKPERYDTVVFQDGKEDNLSHPFTQSSRENYFCRPMDPAPQADGPEYDALTCATAMTYTDKGKRDPSVQSKYPPRQDVIVTEGTDDTTVSTFPAMNGFDAVSQATPPAGELTTFGWAQPAQQPMGDYVLWVEVSTEYDHNATYSVDARPAPASIPYATSGEPYRGQPSVVFKVPFSVTTEEQYFRTLDYAGYGDPDGHDGTLRSPDATITTDVIGSGLNRLAEVVDPDGNFRIRVRSSTERDEIAPAVPMQLGVSTLTSRSATFDFISPGDDGVTGRPRAYEIRYRQGSSVTDANFDDPDSIVVPSMLSPAAGGSQLALTLDGLLPETDYSVGIRAIDDCGNKGAIAAMDFLTPERAIGEVDACFVATAAYGSTLAGEVSMLRGMRDRVLRRTVLGELAVEAYYTFSPPLAGMVGESEVLRWTAREVLRPAIAYVKRFAW